jgi:putative tricarboxylic transport membrane protein
VARQLTRAPAHSSDGAGCAERDASPAVAGRRSLEIWTAVSVALFGALISAESLTHDIGWNETGPGPGYFPFRVGLLTVCAAVALLTQNVRVHAPDVFLTHAQLRRVVSVFWPTVALVAAMFPLGCYVPSAIYLAWMMRRHGGYRWIWAGLSAATITIVFYAIFDLWFRVPLAKGPLEAALGLY